MTQLNIHFDFCFFYMRKSLWHREDEKNNRNTHKSITAVIQWLSMNSKCVCHILWGTGLTGFICDFEVQHCHLWTGPEAAGSWRITSSCWGHWCVFLRCWGSDKEKQGHLNSTEDRYRRKFERTYVDVYRTKAMEVFGSDFYVIFHICTWLKKI